MYYKIGKAVLVSDSSTLFHRVISNVIHVRVLIAAKVGTTIVANLFEYLYTTAMFSGAVYFRNVILLWHLHYIIICYPLKNRKAKCI